MKKLLILFLVTMAVSAHAQQWGLYTLYSVKGTNTAYLIDTNNVVYKTWTFPANKKTCFTSYLIPGDTLVRTVLYPNNVITGGPISGETQKVDWNNNVVWDFIYSDSVQVSHHDICPMPNGNVLLISYDMKTAAEGLAAGSSVNGPRHSEKIIEVHPTGPTSGTIVWQWKLWDHLCQDHDPSKSNYVSSIVMNPQLINLNYDVSAEFIHMNGIDYNAALDQITFSSFAFSELFVIDHSTTTAEAASHAGGNSGHGGDILYRWGNPAAYQASGTRDFVEVHDAHWVSADNPFFPNYLCGFNNKGGVGSLSCVDIFLPPYNGYNYQLTPGSAYTPATYAWRSTAGCTTANEGGSQQLANGNTLFSLTYCDSIVEVTYSGARVWSMLTPGAVTMAFRYSKCEVRGPVASAWASDYQVPAGTQITLHSAATSVTETSPAYSYAWSSVPAGFTSGSQNPTATLYVNTTYRVTITNTALGCSDTASVTVNTGAVGIPDNRQPGAIAVYPNPADGFITIELPENTAPFSTMKIYNLMGQLTCTEPLNGQNRIRTDISHFKPGLYLIKIETTNAVRMAKFIKAAR